MQELKICDINLTTREIHISGYKSATSDRDGVLSIKARNTLKRYIGSRTDGYVFIPKKSKNDIVNIEWRDRKYGKADRKESRCASYSHSACLPQDVCL